MLKRFLISLVLISATFDASAKLQLIDRDRTWIANEPTFQDQGMVDEPGRMTFATPHKRQKFEAMIAAFLRNVKAPSETKRSDVNHAGFKPGVKLEVPGSASYIVDMEPVCVEWNQHPKRVYELAEAWGPVYQAAREVGLRPYVRPAAERSGMGHMHAGGRTVADNPYFRHPTLLRNMMVYQHQHPSLLWGFGEAYDIGENSNIETHHGPRQAAFEKTVAEFDHWYKGATPAERVDGGFKFITFLHRNGGDDFFRHYRFMNLGHVRSLVGGSLATHGSKSGKHTVEHRNLRPAPTEHHVQALGELLISVMDSMATPDKLVPFKMISADEYSRFHSATRTLGDWEIVKRELELEENPYWEEMIAEYVQNQGSQAQPHPSIRGLTYAPAYSEKGNKGLYWELSLPASGEYAHTAPEAEVDGRILSFERVSIKSKAIWVAVLKTKEFGQSIEALLSRRDFRLRPAIGLCGNVFGKAG